MLLPGATACEGLAPARLPAAEVATFKEKNSLYAYYSILQISMQIVLQTKQNIKK